MDLDGRTRQFFFGIVGAVKGKGLSPHELPMTDAWQ